MLYVLDLIVLHFCIDNIIQVLYLSKSTILIIMPLSIVLCNHADMYYVHSFSVGSIKAPQKSARTVGVLARKKAKLGSILDQVHSDLVKERKKGW